MKKIGLLLALILALTLVFTACGKKEKPEEPQTESAEPVSDGEQETETAAEKILNEKPVKLYYMDYGASTAYLVKNYDAPWSPDEDLAVFGAFNSDAEEIDCTSEKYVHKDLWDSVQTDAVYKIGYEISFDVNGEHKIFTLLEPRDVDKAPELFNGDWENDEITGYMGVWIYDDINQEDGAWYSHLLQEDMTEDTLMTSIKLRPTYDADQISNFKLKVFSYSSSKEFDSDGHYCGGYGYEININNK